jgi:hypothetical protein
MAWRKRFVGLEVAQRVIHGEAELPILQHDATVRVGLAAFHQLGPEQGVAIEEDGRQAHHDAVFLADLGDAVLHDLQVAVGFRLVRRAEGQGLEKVIHGGTEAFVGDLGLLHQIEHRSQRTDDFGVINNGRGQAAEIARRFHLVIGFRIVGDLLRHADEAERAVGHVFQDVLRLAEDLRGLGTVDGVEIGVVLQDRVCGPRTARLARSSPPWHRPPCRPPHW